MFDERRELAFEMRRKEIEQNPTSSRGRFQLSLEKAYNVSWPMPSRAQWETISFTVCAPRTWPIHRGRPRAVAQRPLPSMMMATWAGRFFILTGVVGAVGRAGTVEGHEQSLAGPDTTVKCFAL